MTTSPSESPARERSRFSRSLPVIAGSVIAAAGLAFGSLSVAGASTGHQPPSIDQQAAKVVFRNVLGIGYFLDSYGRTARIALCQQEEGLQ